MRGIAIVRFPHRCGGERRALMFANALEVLYPGPAYAVLGLFMLALTAGMLLAGRFIARAQENKMEQICRQAPAEMFPAMTPVATFYDVSLQPARVVMPGQSWTPFMRRPGDRPRA